MIAPLQEEQIRLAYIKAGDIGHGGYAAFRAGMLAGYSIALKLHEELLP